MTGSRRGDRHGGGSASLLVSCGFQSLKSSKTSGGRRDLLAQIVERKAKCAEVRPQRPARGWQHCPAVCLQEPVLGMGAFPASDWLQPDYG